MNNRYLAALGAALLLALPLSAQAEATAAEAAWTPPVVTAEEMDAAHLGERILMRGLEGDDVRLMQQRLYDLGYLDGDVDGKFGLQTQKAVRAFQRAHKLEKIDGKVGEQTLAALFGDDVIALPTPMASSHAQPDAYVGSDGDARAHACAHSHARYGACAVRDARDGFQHQRAEYPFGRRPDRDGRDAVSARRGDGAP